MQRLDDVYNGTEINLRSYGLRNSANKKAISRFNDVVSNFLRNPVGCLASKSSRRVSKLDPQDV